MKIMIRVFQRLVNKYPITIDAVQTGILMGTGDIVAQVFAERKRTNDINVLRTGQFCLIGSLIVGPSLRIWYGILQKYISNGSKTAALKKVIADQFLFAPAFIAVVLSIIGISQGHSIEEVKKKLINEYPDVIKNNYKVWPAVQICNFYFIPLRFQVLLVQIVAIFWNSYISWKTNISEELKKNLEK